MGWLGRAVGEAGGCACVRRGCSACLDNRMGPCTCTGCNIAGAWLPPPHTHSCIQQPVLSWLAWGGGLKRLHTCGSWINSSLLCLLSTCTCVNTHLYELPLVQREHLLFPACVQHHPAERPACVRDAWHRAHARHTQGGCATSRPTGRLGLSRASSRDPSPVAQAHARCSGAPTARPRACRPTASSCPAAAWSSAPAGRRVTWTAAGGRQRASRTTWRW